MKQSGRNIVSTSDRTTNRNSSSLSMRALAIGGHIFGIEHGRLKGFERAGNTTLEGENGMLTFCYLMALKHILIYLDRYSPSAGYNPRRRNHRMHDC